MSSPTLTEDEVDDVLYYARINSLPDLKEVLESFSSRSPPSTSLTQATDSWTGNSALHMSAANGHLDATAYILTNSSTLSNLQNLSGSTPLHYAALNGHLEVVKFLVDTGKADVGIRNGAGKTAFDEAENAGREEVGGWLAGKMKGEEKAKEGYAGAGGDDEIDVGEEVEIGDGATFGDGVKEPGENNGREEGVEAGVGSLKIDENGK